MNEIAAIFDGLNRVSQIVQLKDQYVEYEQTDRKRCGACDHWMKSSLCPKEKNINGRNHGPSMNSYTCDKFLLEKWVKDLKEKRRQVLMARFKELQLEVPAQLKGNN